MKKNENVNIKRILLFIYFYFKGLNLKKDYDILYTNRAQVYLKQGRYQDAIVDCDWALKVRIYE